MPEETSPLLVAINLSLRKGNEKESKTDSASENEESTIEYKTINSEKRLTVKRGEGTSNLAAIMHLFKASVGTGILSLPTAIKDAGTVVGPLGLTVVAVLAVHCMHLLVNCSRYLCKKHQCQCLSYGELAELCCKPYLGTKSRFAKNVINLFLTINQFGICSIYIVFVAKTIVEISAIEINIDTRLVILALTPLAILFSFVRSLEKLAYLSVMANIFCVSGLIMILQFLGRNLKDPGIYPMFAGWSRFPISASIAIFAFEGITVVLPLFNEIKKPNDFTWVVNISMAFVTAFYIMIGLFGYIAFGKTISGSVTLNLPDNWLYDIVKCTYAVGTFFTFFIQFYVPMQVLLPFLLSKLKGRRFNMIEYLLRAVFVIFTCLCAIGIPQIGNFISLVGAVASSGLAIVFPALIHILTFRNEGLSKVVFGKDLFIILIGIAAFGIGGYSSLAAIYIGFRTSNNTYI